MDFASAHAPDENWTLAHEQYRPFVMFHRIQSAALSQIEKGDGGADAVREIDTGLGDLRELFDQWDTEESFEDNELVQRLTELRRSLHDQYKIEPSLTEKLSKAIVSEEYELAAKIRDEIRLREQKMN